MRNHKGLLSFLTASALILSIYSFSFFLVEDVKDVDISMEYHYPTATSASLTAVTTSPSKITTTKATTKTQSASTMLETTTTTEIVTTTTTVPTTTTTVAPTTTTTAATTTTPAPATTTTTKAPATTTTTATTTTFESEIITAPDEPELEIGSSFSEETTFRDNFFTYEIITADPDYYSTLVSTSAEIDWDFPDATSTTTTQISSNNAENAATFFTVKYDGSVKTEDAFSLVCKIVANEVSPSYSVEAIKAQAVAAYSFLKFNADNGDIPSVLVDSNPSDTIIDAVFSVWGKCVYYNGKAAQTNYHASSAGTTTSAKSVWGVNYPYLVAVPCPFDVQDSYYGYSTTLSAETVMNCIESSLGITLSADPSNWLTIQSFSDGKYVSEVNIDGQKVVSGRKLRENILGFKIKSAAFDVFYSDGSFYFTTYGYGHGVGMSQHGANILAQNGFTYEEILTHYYTGVQVL